MDLAEVELRSMIPPARWTHAIHLRRRCQRY